MAVEQERDIFGAWSLSGAAASSSSSFGVPPLPRVLNVPAPLAFVWYAGYQAWICSAMSEIFGLEGQYLIEIVGAVFTLSGKYLSLAFAVLLFLFPAFRWFIRFCWSVLIFVV